MEQPNAQPCGSKSDRAFGYCNQVAKHEIKITTRDTYSIVSRTYYLCPDHLTELNRTLNEIIGAI